MAGIPAGHRRGRGRQQQPGHGRRAAAARRAGAHGTDAARPAPAAGLRHPAAAARAGAVNRHGAGRRFAGGSGGLGLTDARTAITADFDGKHGFSCLLVQVVGLVTQHPLGPR